MNTTISIAILIIALGYGLASIGSFLYLIKFGKMMEHWNTYGTKLMNYWMDELEDEKESNKELPR